MLVGSRDAVCRVAVVQMENSAIIHFRRFLRWSPNRGCVLSTREGRKNTFIKITRDHRNVLVHGRVLQTLIEWRGMRLLFFFLFLIFFSYGKMERSYMKNRSFCRCDTKYWRSDNSTRAMHLSFSLHLSFSSKLSLNGCGNQYRVFMCRVCTYTCVYKCILYMCIARARVCMCVMYIRYSCEGTGLGAVAGRFHPITDILYHSKHRDYLQ